jgi:hypothetical protein
MTRFARPESIHRSVAMSRSWRHVRRSAQPADFAHGALQAPSAAWQPLGAAVSSAAAGTLHDWPQASAHLRHASAHGQSHCVHGLSQFSHGQPQQLPAVPLKAAPSARASPRTLAAPIPIAVPILTMLSF